MSEGDRCRRRAACQGRDAEAGSALSRDPAPRFIMTKPGRMIRALFFRMPQITFETEISDLSHDGRGVAHVEGKAVFVADALPGERVRARIVRKHRHFNEAQTEEVLRASPQRVAARCIHYGVCGGCALQHLEAGAQIEAKQRVLAENFARIGKVEPERWLPPLTRSEERRVGKEGKAAGEACPYKQRKEITREVSAVVE